MYVEKKISIVRLIIYCNTFDRLFSNFLDTVYYNFFRLIIIAGVNDLNAHHIERKGQYHIKMIRQDKNLRNAADLIALFEQQ